MPPPSTHLHPPPPLLSPHTDTTGNILDTDIMQTMCEAQMGNLGPDEHGDGGDGGDGGDIPKVSRQLFLSQGQQEEQGQPLLQQGQNQYQQSISSADTSLGTEGGSAGNAGNTGDVRSSDDASITNMDSPMDSPMEEASLADGAPYVLPGYGVYQRKLVRREFVSEWSVVGGEWAVNGCVQWKLPTVVLRMKTYRTGMGMVPIPYERGRIC